MKKKNTEINEIERLLYDYTTIKMSIINLERQLKELAGDVSVQAADLARETSTNGYYGSSSVEELAMIREEKRNRLNRKLAKSKNYIFQIDCGLEVLCEAEKQIIELRYFQQYPWYRVAYEAQYNERWCRELKTRALKKMRIAIFGYNETYAS